MQNFPRGRRQMEILDDPLTRRGAHLWLQRVLAFYGSDGGVDIEVIDDQIALTDTTAEALYADRSALVLRYQPGSRPMLEAVVAATLAPGMTARQKALALMRRVRDNSQSGLARPDLFCGGSEEDLLKRGAHMCNEVSRLYVCLCQIAGLPARLMSAHISGHMMTEVYVEGTWGWIDPMKGMAPRRDDGSAASAWDLHRDRTLFERQDAAFWADVRPARRHFGDERDLAKEMVRNRDCYFHPREALALGNYFVWDHGRYTYPWRIVPADEKALAEARIAESRNRRAAGWPDVYFDWQLSDEPLKMRPAP